MLRFTSLTALRSKTLAGKRHLSQAAAALKDEEPPPLTYLDGHPRPGPTQTIESIAAKERKLGRVPSIVFEQEDGQHGGNKRLISVQSNQIRNTVTKLGRAFFLSRLFNLEVQAEFGSPDIIEQVRVLPRLNDAPLNVTFIRAPSSALLKIEVPLVFIGEDVSPGLRKGSLLNTIKRTVKFLCPADIIPPYIDVDLSELDVGQKLTVGDLNVHPALMPILPAEHPICKIMGGRVSEKRSK